MYQSPGIYPKIVDEAGQPQNPSMNIVGVICICPDNTVSPKKPVYISGGQTQLVNMFGEATVNYKGYLAAKLIADSTACWVYNVPHTVTGVLAQASSTLKVAEVDSIKITVKKAGVEGNTLNATIVNADVGVFDLVIRSKDGVVVEHLRGLSMVSSATTYLGYAVSNFVSFEILKGNKATDVLPNGAVVFTGGTDSTITFEDADFVEGIETLKDFEKFRVSIMTAPCMSHNPVIATALIANLAEDGVIDGIVCAPENVYVDSDVVAWTNGEDLSGPQNSINSSQVAVYSPWIEVFDKDINGSIFISPECEVIAARVYTMDNFQPWFAPAGAIRGKVKRALSLKTEYDKRSRDLLYGGTNIVNPITKFSAEGFLIYGQKTSLRNPTQQLTRVNVRVLQNYIQKTIDEASKVYVFEPNDQYTWDKWINMADKFMKGIKDARGVYDYKVVMAPTPEEVDRFEMPGGIYYKPTKTSEFIPITFKLVSMAGELD